jgi:hypothetical protein
MPNLFKTADDLETRCEYYKRQYEKAMDEAEQYRERKSFLHTLRRFLSRINGLPSDMDGFDKAYHTTGAEKQRLVVLVAAGTPAKLAMERKVIEYDDNIMQLESMERVEDNVKYKFKV